MTAGSYDYDDMARQDKELEILERQAKGMIAFEQGIWSRSGLKNGMDVLDMGCGPGNISAELARFNSAGTVTGMDSSRLLIETALAYKEKHSMGNLAFCVDDIYEPRHLKKGFDFIYCRFVMQHLQNPEKAMANIWQLLKPSGIVCILEIDDQWFSLDPEPERFRGFIHKSAEYQASWGGERYVGHKLGHYLDRAGFTSICNTIDVITSEMIGIRDFLDLTIQSKAVVLDDDDTDRDLEDIYSMQTLPYAWGALGLFTATAIKD